MANTFVKIASVNVGAGSASTLDFTSIPNTYTDLKLVLSTRMNVARTSLFVRLNGSTSGYSYRSIWGYVDGVSSYNGSSQSEWYIQYPGSTTDTANTFNSSELYIPNYLSSSNKTAFSDTIRENNATGSESAHQVMMGYLWSNTAAVTSITVSINSGTATFDQYSSATLYGISKS